MPALKPEVAPTPGVTREIDLTRAEVTDTGDAVTDAGDAGTDATDAGDGSVEFGFLYDRYLARVRGLARKLIHDRGLAEDMVQEVFLRAYHYGLHLEAFGPGKRRAPWPWLAAVSRNLALDWLRRGHGMVQDELEEEEIPSAPPAEQPEVVLVASRRREGVEEALDRVCERHRRILVMKHVDGRSYEEIAEMEGITVDALKSLLCRARRAFRESYTLVAQRRGLRVSVDGELLASTSEGWVPGVLVA